MPQGPGYTPEELMAVAISRQVVDGETVAVGAVSPVPAAGCVLAEQLHAPQATFIILGSTAYYPFPAGSSELHFLAQRGELDLFFLSGLQIDRHGNLNLHVIGDYKAPTVRAAGAYGSAMLYYMAHRVVLFRAEHSRRTLVEKVDFVTGAAETPLDVYREGGPTKLITPKATLHWDSGAAEWLLESIQPGSSLQDVKENTGFELRVSAGVSTTPGPTEQELATLRGAVKAKLESIYPDFAQEKILANGNGESRGA